MTPHSVLSDLWSGLGLPADALAWANVTGRDPALPSSFAVGTAATASIAASALAAASLWRLRGGPEQTVSVDMRHACAEFWSEQFIRIDGREEAPLWDSIAGLYPCSDGWLRLHTNFAHHRDGVLKLLGCEGTRDAVGAALKSWRALDFEDAAAAAGCAVTALRSFAEWDAHPQAQAVRTLPLISLTRIGDAPPSPLPASKRPLDGVRVAELTRVIAGPVCGRTLAVHGADVMNITGPGLPSVRIDDLGRGKLAAQVDLRAQAGRDALAALVQGADVFVQGYRPGAIAGHGFAPAQLAALRPGIISASLSAYGPAGPWSQRRGFDSLVQTASGFNVAEAQAFGQDAPRPLPVQALDHATGYLLALGIITALHRRVTDGGSWHVEVSLARTALWLRGLGRIEGGTTVPNQTAAGVADLLETTQSGFGTMHAIRHAAQMSRTPPHWTRPSVPLGTHPLRWP
jgi:crotonobetainyl-CoA:carnitine CoA-transferase CaiB-like acyl-CoA transferase